MRDLLPFLVIGLTTGSVYGLIAVGLTLTFKTSGIFNFAHGSIAALAIGWFYVLWHHHGWSRWKAVFVAVVVLGVVLGVLFERLARRLSRASAAQQVSATVGALLFIDWLAPTFFRVLNLAWTPPFHFTIRRDFEQRGNWLSDRYRTIGGVVVGDEQLVIMAVALLATVGLFVVLRRTRLGIAMRAVVDDAELLGLCGTSPTRVRRWVWMIGVSFAALGGLLIQSKVLASAVQGTGSGVPEILTLLVVQATGAAAVGGFASVPLAYGGGLALGVASSVLVKYASGWSLFWAGLPVSAPFLFLFGALILVPRRRLPVRTRNAAARRPRLASGSSRWSLLLSVMSVAVLLLVPSQVSDIGPWTRGLTYVVLFLSLGLLVRTSGQISLCHFGFAAVGAAAFHWIATNQSWPWPVMLIAAGMVTVPVGALIAIPAIRLSGVYLALATFAFGYLLQFFFYNTSWMFGVGGLLMPRPSTGASDHGFYFVALACVTLVVALVMVIERTRLGRLLAALADSPTALETHGTDTTVVRVVIFSLSAFLAGISGALLGCAYLFITDVPFVAYSSLALVTLVMVIPGGSPFYAFPAAAALVVIQGDIHFGVINWWQWHLGLIGNYRVIENVNDTARGLLGLVAILAALSSIGSRHRLRRFLSRVRTQPAPPMAPAIPRGPVGTHTGRRPGIREPQPSGLRIDSLTVSYGNLIAVDDLSLHAPPGHVTALIGPNGAGKSTTFDACCGLLRPRQGHVELHDLDVTHHGPSARARLGLGRTFQRMQLWDSLTVAQNVAMGREGNLAGRNPFRQLITTASERQEIDLAAHWALDRCGIAELAHLPAIDLTSSQRRLVELARCLASGADVLLLDEPSSGLDITETAAFGAIVADMADQERLAVLLVEHNMGLVMDISQQIYVLDAGRLIAAGTSDDIRTNPAVQAAYLGTTRPAASPPAYV
ncbi:MAG: ATP-binding cassette domain-containing protein [Acidobacteria bacterium]|nr:ATP-binding cassette domain-containing protein [Acidobacteriota bacterium]